MVRIGEKLFSTYEEAQEWVDQGNICGCYSIVPLTWCVHCEEWQDTKITAAVDEVCTVCQRFPEKKEAPETEYMERQERDYEKLESWNQWAKSQNNPNEPVYLT